MKAFLFILLATTGIGALAQQTTVQGRVYDGGSKAPLPGVTVFIANTTFGVSTGKDGEFMIKGLARNHYKLVISFMGFETQVLDIVPGESVVYKIMLQPSPLTLNEVVVRAKKSSRAEWLANFKVFKERFIGLSENARYCTFENPGLLSFNKEDGILQAFADSALIVENRGLGYRIKILLSLYQFNFITIGIYYQGQMVYEPLTPENDEQKVKWAKARLKAYNGSGMHFLRSLYKQDLFENGFYYNLLHEVNTAKGIQLIGYADSVKTPVSPIYGRKIKIQTLTDYASILDTARSTPEEPVLSYKGILEIQYINEAEPSSYQVNRGLFTGKNIQRSTIILHKSCIVEPHGTVYPPDAIETKNYWSWELVAESLPLDYDPKVDQAIIAADE